MAPGAPLTPYWTEEGAQLKAGPTRGLETEDARPKERTRGGEPAGSCPEPGVGPKVNSQLPLFVRSALFLPLVTQAARHTRSFQSPSPLPCWALSFPHAQENAFVNPPCLTLKQVTP